VAVAEAGRDGEVRFIGDIDSAPEAVERFVAKLGKRHCRLAFCYEAGPSGYGLHRQFTVLKYDCMVVAPSLISRRPGERVKTSRRDAMSLAKLHRAGELTPVWIPDPSHEADRGLVRAREAAMEIYGDQDSTFSLFCAMAGSSQAAPLGAKRTLAGSAGRRSTILRSILSWPSIAKPSRMPRPDSSAWLGRSQRRRRPGLWRR
jgi:hypothetical protein